MKSNLKLGIALLVIVLIATALMQANQKERINWDKTFSPKDKIPYGTFVIKKELKNILPKSQNIKTVNQTLYTFLDGESYGKNDAILFIGRVFNIGEASNNQVLDFVKKGGTLFASAEDFESPFLDSLKLNISSFNEYKAHLELEESIVKIYLPNGNSAVYNKMKYFNLFDQLDESTTHILGYVEKGEVAVPNFIKIKYGAGQVFLHLSPEVFTNYYVLQKNPFSVAHQSLSVLNGKNILWYDGQYNYEQETTPLRFILSNPALRSAWYLLLFVLIIYLIFKSKREQRAVPIVTPEPNLSIAFAKTIGSLYYENGSPENMVLKKIEYFLFQLRKQYNLSTENLSDPQFIYALGQRTAIPESEIKTFLSQIQSLQSQATYSIEDLKNTYHIIEQFKQKANLL